MKQFIGQEVEANSDLMKQDNKEIKLVSVGNKYKVISVVNESNFIIKNDAGNFDVIHCSYFKVPIINNTTE